MGIASEVIAHHLHSLEASESAVADAKLARIRFLDAINRQIKIWNQAARKAAEKTGTTDNEAFTVQQFDCGGLREKCAIECDWTWVNMSAFDSAERLKMIKTHIALHYEKQLAGLKKEIEAAAVIGFISPGFVYDFRFEPPCNCHYCAPVVAMVDEPDVSHLLP